MIGTKTVNLKNSLTFSVHKIIIIIIYYYCYEHSFQETVSLHNCLFCIYNFFTVVNFHFFLLGTGKQFSSNQCTHQTDATCQKFSESRNYSEYS